MRVLPGLRWKDVGYAYSPFPRIAHSLLQMHRVRRNPFSNRHPGQGHQADFNLRYREYFVLRVNSAYLHRMKRGA